MKKWSKWSRVLAAALSVAAVSTSVLPALADAAPDGSTKAEETAAAANGAYDAWKSVWAGLSQDWTQVSMTPGSTETEMNFAWYSKTEDGVPAFVYGKNADLSDGIQATVNQSGAQTGYNSNKVTLNNLEANTTYYYQAAGKEIESFTTKDSSSFNFVFVGDPQIGSSNEEKAKKPEDIAKDTFKQAQYDSVQSDSFNWANTLNQAMMKAGGNVSFILSAGDQIQTNAKKVEDYTVSEIEYAGYLSPDVLKSVPVATTVGNHDADNQNYQYHFNIPNLSEKGSNGIVGGDYWFTYGDVLFMMLNTQDTNPVEHGEFMKEAVEANKDCKWRIVTLHQDIYGSAEHSNEPEIVNLRYALIPYFEEYDVDVVLTGHDHAYSRSQLLTGDGVKDITYTDDEFDEQLEKDMDAGENPETRTLAPGNIQDGTADEAEQAYLNYLHSIMDEEAVVAVTKDVETAVNPEGILYMTANSASGSKYYDLVPRMQSYIAARWQEDVPTYSVVSVDETSFKITTYRSDTNEAIDDTFTIVKDADKKALQEEIANVSGIDSGKYTAESYRAFEAALLGATEVVNNVDAGQSDIENALVALKNAYAALVELDAPIQAVEADYGYYVDVYQTNSSSNMSPESNAAIGVLSQMLNIFTPGDEWNNGTVLNEATHLENLENTKAITEGSTKEEQELAYLDDRRNQNYSMVSGLGIYAEEFIEGSGARTSIPDEVPADASTVQYTDEYGDNAPWADEDSEYGDIVKLVNAVRQGAASTSSAKKYYKYARPFRWSGIDADYPEINVIDILQPCIKADASNDGGYPSGHTNAAYLAGISMAYAVPQQYQQMIYRASELGNNRIVTGMHSCMDVMGGRTMATAVAAANLNDPENAEIKANAVSAGEKLVSAVDTQAEYENYQKDKETYLYRMTYGLSQTGDTNKPMVVPKGAEVLLESRFPYLDESQRRYVLYTTGIESGYPVLDDAEGWGRLNLFEAASGYGEFVTDVTVNMDAALGGFNASDNWKNDISGTGALTKEGSGLLALSGQNSYTGGTNVNGGTIVASSANAFGKGNVENNSSIVENTVDTVNISGNYTQGKDAVLELTVSSKEDILKIAGNANFHGALKLTFDNGFAPEAGFAVIESAGIASQFDKIEVSGLSKDLQVSYQGGKVIVSSVNDSNTTNPSDDGTKPGNTNQPGNINQSGNTTQSGNNASTQNVKTGDTQNIVIWCVLLAAAGVGATGVIVYRKKKKTNIV